MSTLAAKYTVRAADAVQDREQILALWHQAFPFPAQHPIKYDWCYVPTPQGDGRLYLLEYGDEPSIIGVQGIVPRRWWFNGEAKATGICADLVVDINHRSIGPALALVRGVVDIEKGLPGAFLLYGFPNPRSEALYRRAGYTKMGEITRYARPLRHSVWLIRKGVPSVLASFAGFLIDQAVQLRFVLATIFAPRRWRLIPVTGFDSRFDDLWSRVANNVGPMVMRTSEYLRWRFGNNYAGQTQVMAMVGEDGKLDGYIVYVVSTNKMVNVQDFLVIDDVKVLSTMLKLFVHLMYRQGHHGIMLEFTGPKPIADTIIQSGFSPRETNPIYAVLNDADSGLLEGAVPYFTASDRDQ